MLVIQLNELNFDYAKHYIEKYNLVNFKSLIKLNNCITSSETKYETLEPWIQWVTFNTGKSADEHEIFRLGDVDNLKYQQIYEKVEDLGYKVGGSCPMNTKNKLKKPVFLFQILGQKLMEIITILTKYFQDVYLNLLIITLKKSWHIKLFYNWFINFKIC